MSAGILHLAVGGDPGGSAPNPGDLFVQPGLAETLRTVARHGAREKENGATIHECIRQIIEAIVETGALHDSDGHIDDEFQEEHGQLCRRAARVL